MNASTLSSFRRFALLAFPLAAIFAACNSPTDVVIGTDQQPIACNAGAICPNNQACVNGFCDPQSGTTGSGNGGSGTTGSGNGGNSGTSASNVCTTDMECPAGQLCESGACQIGTSASTGGMGGANPNACLSDVECNPGQLCLNGVCQVGTSASTGGMGCMGMLPKPEVCDGIDNDCDGVVDDGVTCPNNGTCTSGACVASACMSNSDCVPGQQTCVAGVCQNIVTCMSNAQCNPMQVCLNGVCQP